MVWAQSSRRRSLAVNGAFLRLCRERCGWTQGELARHTGLSERLIRKAEASGRLQPASIKRLSVTLSTDGQEIYPEDLTFHPVAMTTAIVDTYVCRRPTESHSVDEMIDEAVVCWCSGEPRALPFAGEYLGRESFEAFWVTLANHLVVPDPAHFAPRMLVDGNEVLVMGDGYEFTAADGKGTKIWWILHCRFTRGLLVHCAMYIDTLCASSAAWVSG
jgi:hypothetical protein